MIACVERARDAASEARPASPGDTRSPARALSPPVSPTPAVGEKSQASEEDEDEAASRREAACREAAREALRGDLETAYVRLSNFAARRKRLCSASSAATAGAPGDQVGRERAGSGGSACDLEPLSPCFLQPMHLDVLADSPFHVDVASRPPTPHAPAPSPMPGYAMPSPSCGAEAPPLPLPAPSTPKGGGSGRSLSVAPRLSPAVEVPSEEALEAETLASVQRELETMNSAAAELNAAQEALNAKMRERASMAQLWAAALNRMSRRVGPDTLARAAPYFQARENVESARATAAAASERFLGAAAGDGGDAAALAQAAEEHRRSVAACEASQRELTRTTARTGLAPSVLSALSTHFESESAHRQRMSAVEGQAEELRRQVTAHKARYQGALRSLEALSEQTHHQRSCRSAEALQPQQPTPAERPSPSPAASATASPLLLPLPPRAGCVAVACPLDSGAATTSHCRAATRAEGPAGAGSSAVGRQRQRRAGLASAHAVRRASGPASYEAGRERRRPSASVAAGGEEPDSTPSI
eukprot:TRINITY_DN64540_c0_g1_i1.p1 TRINITY_DN64540_c0_g1~~TRINITY_DN64540_c0_g1_i1.p1  ORF type:complete len:532 (+),score=129.67 TRINITY_DN64540_c0_g1_i1:235-1830(+)